MKNCKSCTSRYVGCHSSCQPYIVNKIIQSYKRDKINKERDLGFNNNYHSRHCKENIKRHDNFKLKVYKGC